MSGQPDEMHPDMIMEALAEGATVVTGNRRLARNLLDAYNVAQNAAGRDVWETPEVLPWGGWLQRAWETLGQSLTGLQGPAGKSSRPALLLTPFQELVLWEQIVRDSAWGGALLQPGPAARAACEAWDLMHAWRLDLASVAAQRDAWSEDTRAYLDWARSYQRRCEERGWLDQARLSDWVADSLTVGSAARILPARMVLVGFDELTPQQTEFVDVVGGLGVVVELAPPAAIPARVRSIALAEPEAELTMAARWARLCLEGDPNVRVGIVVPELTTMRERVERIFDDVLLPAAVLPGTCSPETLWRARPYNISAGRPLADYPLVHAAFLILGLGDKQQPVERVGALLRSSFTGLAESESEARARFDARLRRRGEITIGIRGLLALLQPDTASGSPSVCPALRDLLTSWTLVWRALPRRQAPSRWAEDIPRLLAALGWPGERGLDSLEYQTAHAFRERLAALAGLDVLEGEVSLSQAVGALQRLCNTHLFQPEGGQVPVQVLGALEAAGLHFDYMWVMGLHDEAWPTAPRPNPLLPIRMQREAGVPHASPERELAFAARITERLCSTAPDVVLSWPQRDGDRDLRPSPIIRAHAQAVAELEELTGSYPPFYCEALVGTASIEPWEDNRATEVTTEVPSGGTAIFKHQAACPFRAFAEHRLGAAPLEEAHLGLDARGRGIVLHTALEYLWTALGSQGHVAALSAGERQGQVTAAAERAVDQMAARHPATFTPRFRALEVQRLVGLLVAWLDRELERAPFTVVHQEQEERIVLGGVSVQLKIDRIDRLDDGALAIIDYKSGRTDVGDWLGDRPEEPQLPLYALSQDSNGEAGVAAVLFAQLRPGELCFKGLARESDWVPGADTLDAKKYAADYPDWPALLDHWRRTLSELGEAFRAGKAEVDPKRYPQTCRYCELPLLCRIGEQHEFGPDETEVEDASPNIVDVADD